MTRKLYDVVVLTDARYVNPKNTNQYIENVLLEDQLVLSALEYYGLKAIKKAWDDPNFDWSSTRSALFRTTWDYFERFSEFSEWLNVVTTQTTLINSEALLRWNIDKHYLLDLNSKGINIPETVVVEKGSSATLSMLCEKLPATAYVLKPCVSGAGRHTYRFTEEKVGQFEEIFASLIAQEAMMLQVFQENIVKQGEISLMVFGTTYSHAVLKVAKAGDFRVQDDFGGSVHDYTPSEAEIIFAQKAVAACPEPPLYARVDLFRDNNNSLALAELELIEPELWFRRNPKAAQLMANAVYHKLNT